ncbi:PAS domain S-box-containing protein [Desulforhopalus singaporensis]|uniref:histidine kinase n=2 Tax=Desulforhopalus singaporensis TaxID=91360 RepID=A0A1H0PS87_9BACT|nr:PAS domain S-box-containing protein [Desulforhopalus singaporensis]
METARKTEINYQALFHSSPVPAFILENTGTDIILIDFNPSVSKIIRNIGAHNLDQSVDVIFPGFYELNLNLRSCSPEHPSFVLEALYRSHQGLPATYLQFNCCYVDPNLLVVSVQNIHRKRQAESDLEKSRERLELAIAATGAGVWDWYLVTGEVVFEDEWAAILDYKPHEIKPHISSWEQLIHPEDKQRVYDMLDRHISGELPRYKSEHRLRAKGGNWVWVLDVGKIVERSTDGSPIRMTGTKVDISKHKKLEAELELLNRELEKRIEDRTQKLEQSKRSLLRNRQDLQKKSQHLTEVNNALKVLLKKSDENKADMEENMLANAKELILPYLEKIEEESLNETQLMYMGIVKTNLKEIVLPFSRKLTSKYLNLTPSELTVADLIKHGKSTKEIASLLYLSEKTIATQRKNIRKKIGINRKKVNLRTYLHTFQE